MSKRRSVIMLSKMRTLNRSPLFSNPHHNLSREEKHYGTYSI
jgi:hypothetical protein